jgi:hypothetical protein
MATTAFFLILSDVVGTQYERDGRASWGSIKFYLCNLTSKDIKFNTYGYVYYYFDGPSREQKGPTYGIQSPNKLFDDFLGFYYLKSMAYVPHALCVGLGS